jgi:Ca2+:H+ antiporter
MLLSVAAMSIPSLAFWIHSPAAEHEDAFSVIVSVLLLILFVLFLPASLRREAGEETSAAPHEQPRWPVWLAVGMLAVTGLLAAFVSEWFVSALEPAMDTLIISEAFAGLVVVAIAGTRWRTSSAFSWPPTDSRRTPSRWC